MNHGILVTTGLPLALSSDAAPMAIDSRRQIPALPLFLA
jgi:hypothetical protein